MSVSTKKAHLEPITTDQVWELLKTVIDPETNLPIVDMGLIYEVVVKSGKVIVTYTLTTPGCPLAGMIQLMMRSSLAPLKTNNFDPLQDVTFNLTFDPPWTIELMSEQAKAQFDWLF